jgi:hypothetical protein
VGRLSTWSPGHAPIGRRPPCFSARILEYPTWDDAVLTVFGGPSPLSKSIVRTGPLMEARAGGLLAARRLVNSVVFDLCRGPAL